MCKSAVSISHRLSRFLILSLICGVLSSTTIPEGQNLVDEIISKLYQGQIQTAKGLVQKLSDIDSLSSDGSPLLVALAQVPGLSDADLLDQVFKKHPNCNLRNKKGMTALYFAASVGNIELVDHLLKGGASVNADSDFGSALVGAVWNKRIAIAHDLLSLPNINVNLADQDGRTALIFAVIQGNLSLVRELILKGANPNIYEIESGNSPLIWSAQGSKEVVAFLLDSNADSRLRNPFNCQTVVHAAVAANNLDVVRLLLSRNLIVSFADSQGQTPLGIAKRLPSNDISNLLIDYLNSKGMNVSETGGPPPNCRDDRLITYAHHSVSSTEAPDDRSQAFIPLAKTVVETWELKNNIFLSPDTPVIIAGDVSLFKTIVCHPNNAPRIVAGCRALLTDRTKVSALIEQYLDETYSNPKETTTCLAARMSQSIGVDFRRAGYSVRLPNGIVCSRLPQEYVNDPAQIADADGIVNLRPGVSLCLSQDKYQVLIPSKDVLVESTFFLRATNPTPNFKPLPLNAMSAFPYRIVPSAASVSFSEQPVESPLTMPLPRRDDIRIAAPRNFSTVNSVQVSINDDSGLCDTDCKTVVTALLVKAIAVWKLGCTRCSPENLLTLQFPNISYFNVEAVKSLILGATRSPLPGEVECSSMPTLSYTYEKLDNDNPRILRLCGLASLPQLCGKFGGFTSMKLVLDISNKSDACSTTRAVACAAPNGVIHIRAADHIFTWKRSSTMQSTLFGSGTEEFDLLAVLIHELGHFFGLPHLDKATPKIAGKSDVMVPTYDPGGFWVTRADYTLLNKAVDPSWPFRLDGCAGLMY